MQKCKEKIEMNRADSCERSRAKRGELAELASLRKARELIVPVIEETKLAHISKTKHFRHMMYRTRIDYFHP